MSDLTNLIKAIATLTVPQMFFVAFIVIAFILIN